ASGVPVVLEVEEVGTGWKQIGRGATDKDGRLRDLLGEGTLVEGTYRLTFDTHTYFAGRRGESFYPQVTVVFSVRDAHQDYHVPVLLRTFAYSTYRGTCLMTIGLGANNYGKSRVRLLRVNRQEGRHDIKELAVAVSFEGDFEAAHTKGDNTKILPTDTMKNTVYALARQHP